MVKLDDERPVLPTVNVIGEFGGIGFTDESSKFIRSAVVAPEGDIVIPAGAAVSVSVEPSRKRPVMTPATVKFSVANLAASTAVMATELITGARSNWVTKLAFTFGVQQSKIGAGRFENPV